MRWFVEGEVPSRLRPTGRPGRRLDAYDVETLRPWLAVKRRGRAGVLEQKVRVGRVELVEVAGVPAFAETWVKTRLGRQRHPGPWLEVRKQWWSSGQVEIGRVEVGERVGWTVCVDWSRALSPASGAILDRWRSELTRRGESSSYPAWLGRRGVEIAASA